jgi:SAM-dependent methyltransferase
MDIREAGQCGIQNESDHWWIRTRLHYLASGAELAARRFEGLRVLEMGCGTAQNIRFLREEWALRSNVRSVVGIEPQSGGEGAGGGWMSAGDRVLRSLGDLQPDDRFEMLVAMDVLEHVDDDVAALREWAARLVPGAMACITVPAFQWLWSYHDEALGHRRRYTKQGLLALAASAGLKPIGSGYIFSWLLPVAYAVRVAFPRKSKSDQGSDLTETNAALNRVLTGVGKLEVRLGANPFFGTSVVGLFETTRP